MASTRLTLVILGGLSLSACGLPRDPRGALERVEGGTLRVGVSVNAPWTATELNHVSRLAAILHAKPIIEQGAESALIHKLERGELDMVAGGLEKSTPWKKKVGLTRPYPGGEGKHVLAVQPGENAFLLKVDQLLEAQAEP